MIRGCDVTLHNRRLREGGSFPKISFPGVLTRGESEVSGSRGHGLHSAGTDLSHTDRGWTATPVTRSCRGHLNLPRPALPSLRSVFWTWAPPWVGFGVFLVPRGPRPGVCLPVVVMFPTLRLTCAPFLQLSLCLSFPAPFSSHWGLWWNLLFLSRALTLLGCPSSWRHPTYSHARDLYTFGGGL